LQQMPRFLSSFSRSMLETLFARNPSPRCHAVAAGPAFGLRICGIFFALALSAFGAPKIEFANTTFDFGKVPAGQIITHGFTFTNTGDQVLQIKDVRPSCGCTTTSGWEREIMTGKTANIPIRFNSTEYTGPIHKTVIIICDDPAQTNLVLHIQGTIWRPIEVTPEGVVFITSSDRLTNETKIVRIVN